MRLTQAIRRLFARTTVPDDPGSRVIFVPVRQAGERVDEETALKFSAVFRAVSYISQTVGCLAWHVYREDAGGRKERLASDPVDWLLHRRPNPEMSALDFRQTMVAWALTWGNGYAEIERNMAGQPVALWPIHPQRVKVDRDRDDGRKIVYEVGNVYGGTSYLSPDNVFHLKGLGPDGLVGYSVVSLAAKSIGIGMAAERFNASFYENGAVLSGALKHPGKLSKDAGDRLREDFAKRHAGGANAHKPAILQEGMEWQSIGIPPEDAQMLESRKFQVTDIARWFGLPPHKLADLERSTHSNIEHQAMEVVGDAILPWCVRLEQEADFKLLGRRYGNTYSRLNLMSLLRGDNQSRAELYKTMREIGVYSTNDIRRLEDMDPVGPEGDKLIVQMNMTTLERIGEEPAQDAPALPVEGGADDAA